jgi:hypothetical protein
MAYTIEVNKKSADRISPTEFNVTVDAVFKQDGIVVMEKSYSKRYILKEPITSIRDVLQKQMQADLDKYKAEQAVLDNLDFDSMCKSMEIAVVAIK